MRHDPSPIIGPGPTGGYLKVKQEALEKKKPVFKTRTKTITVTTAYCPYCDVPLESLRPSNLWDASVHCGPDYRCNKCGRNW